MNTPEHSNRKRVAIVRPYAEPIRHGFYNSQEQGLAGGLTRTGCDVDVFVVGRETRCETLQHSTDTCGSINLYEMRCNTIPNVRQAIFPAVRAHLETGNYDAIQTNESNEIESWLISRLARRLKRPLVLYQGMYEPISGRVQKSFQFLFDRFCLPELVRNTTIAFAKTRRAARFVESRGFNNVQILPVGLDTRPFAPTNNIDWKKELGIPAGTRIVLYVGVLEPRRNTKLILELAEHLRESCICFVIAGAGPEQGLVETAIANGAQNVRYLGRVPQSTISGLYSQSSCFILPSSYEIYGMVVLEAMYFGLPVIASRTAGPEDIIADQCDGILVSTFDKNDWSKAILEILQNPSLRESMSKRCKQKILNELTWDCIAEKYYKSVFVQTKS